VAALARAVPIALEYHGVPGKTSRMLEYPTEVAFLHALRRVVRAVGGPPAIRAMPHRTREREGAHGVRASVFHLGPAARKVFCFGPLTKGSTAVYPGHRDGQQAAGCPSPPLTSNAATVFSESGMFQVYVRVCASAAPGPGPLRLRLSDNGDLAARDLKRASSPTGPLGSADARNAAGLAPPGPSGIHSPLAGPAGLR
jgi:hypothetical protein